MLELLSRLGVAVAVFVSTNIDDIVLLSAFFADPGMRPRSVVAGQFLGIGVQVAASALAALAALVVPAGYTALLGVVPLALGLRALRARRGAAGGEEIDGESGDDDDALRTAERRADQRTRSQLLAVAGVTVANGGDNLGVYIPLFASAPRAIPLYAAVFAAMTALWCLAGHRLVNNIVIGRHVRRLGHRALPFVLVALGVWILWGARVLL